MARQGYFVLGPQGGWAVVPALITGTCSGGCGCQRLHQVGTEGARLARLGPHMKTIILLCFPQDVVPRDMQRKSAMPSLAVGSSIR